MLSVITCLTPFFVNCTSISVNFEKITILIYESIDFKHVITFIPYLFEGHTIRISTSEHHKSFSTHGCRHYCVLQGTIPNVGYLISKRLL